MFEIYKDVVCVHGGWLYSKRGANVLKKYQYDNYVRRGPYRVMRRAGGKSTPALVAWCSLHPETQEAITKVWGDPEKTTKHIIFADYLERDYKAKKFYNTHILENGTPIPEDIQLNYVAEASIFKAINRVINDRILKTKALGTGGLTDTWKKISTIVQELPRTEYPHRLPKNYRSLQRKYKTFIADGYEALIHGQYGHKNSQKLCKKAKAWVLSRWARQDQKMPSLPQLLDAYNEQAIEKGWKTIKEEKTLYNFLYAPEIKSKWYGSRYGELAAKEKYNYQHSTKMATMRDSLWYVDGTKLNLYYKDADGKRSTCQVTEVIDAFSDVLLGYSVSATETSESSFSALKMAVQNSGHRPYELGADGQGGFKKLTTGNFMGKAAKIPVRTQPYNGKSKTIENAFGRFQQQVMKKLWNFTGQNIDAKKMESKANMEFILANEHKLPDLKTAIAEYEALRLEWNQMKHHKSKLPRLEMYYNSVNPQTPKLDLFDMVDIFWIEREKPVTCTAFGITFTEKKQKYTYMVYDENRMPDFNFLNTHIDRKIHIKYDPDDMGLIYLYEMTSLGLRRIGAAETKIEVARNKQEQDAYDAQFITQVNNANKAKRVEKRDAMDLLLEEHGMLPEQNGFVSPHLKGIEGKKKLTREQRGLAPKAKPQTVGQYQKEVSNMDAMEDAGRASKW